MKNIVILGASYAGVGTAHRILKHSTKTGPFKITLVSPNTYFYWSMASSRAIIPGQLTDQQMFQPIAAGFKQYTASQFEFIIGTAQSLDIDAKKVAISSATGDRVLDYDFLILATGTHTRGGTPFKMLGSTEETKNALHAFQDRLEKAKTIVIAGAGATGVEISGEIGFKYGNQKEIILIASGTTILDGSPASVSKAAIRGLQNLKVDLKLRTKVTSSTQLPDGQQELILSNGEKLTADVYIPTFGLIPNSSYIPSNFLNANGYVIVDEYLKVKGAKDVWAIGDISDVEHSQFIYCDRQSAHLAKNLTLILNHKIPLPYKVASMRIMGVSVGRQFGAGHWGNIKMPNFVIVWIRRNLFMDMMKGTLDGSLY